MKKIYVLDTNVILENPDCILNSFDDNDIVIPLTVLEELDSLKKSSGEIGFYARQAIRNIDKIRENQNISNGVKRNEQGSILKIVTISKQEKEKFDKIGFKTDKNDDSIILTAMKIQESVDKKTPVILISNDISVRIKGSLLDIPTEFCKDSSVSKESLVYFGYRNIEIPLDFFGEVIKGKWSAKRLPLKLDLENIKAHKEIPKPYANEFLLLSPEDTDKDLISKKEKKKLKTVYRFSDKLLHKKSLLHKNVYGGVSGKNLEQSVALDVLLDDSVKVVALSGPSGSGKTFLSLAACLTKLLKEQTNYEKLILLKPTISVSDEIGYLPGNVEDKLSRYMGSYFDNFKTLRKFEKVYTKSASGEDSFEKLKDKGVVEIESISFLRGRSLSDCLIIADEVQNVNQTVIKTILTRVGENCKIILLGDTSQIDRPYLSKYNNGLVYAIEKLKGQEFFAHVKFIQGVRSIVSKYAAELL